MNHHATQSIRVNNIFVVVDDVDAALAFYRDVLGFAVQDDITMDTGFRWLTLVAPGSPGVEITLQSVREYPGATDEDKAMMATLQAKGLLSVLIFDVADVDALFEQVLASGADVVQEPADQFYGVRDCAFRDPAGNMLRFKTDLPPA